MDDAYPIPQIEEVPVIVEPDVEPSVEPDVEPETSVNDDASLGNSVESVVAGDGAGAPDSGESSGDGDQGDSSEGGTDTEGSQGDPVEVGDSDGGLTYVVQLEPEQWAFLRDSLRVQSTSLLFALLLLSAVLGVLLFDRFMGGLRHG